MTRNRLSILCVTLFFFVAVSAQKQFKALLVTTTKGWHHESLHYGVVALKELAARNFFAVFNLFLATLSALRLRIKAMLLCC